MEDKEGRPSARKENGEGRTKRKKDKKQEKRGKNRIGKTEKGELLKKLLIFSRFT